MWGGGWGAPSLKLREVAAVGIGHRRAEVVTSDGLAVMALKVEIHASAEARRAEEGVVHADDL